MLRELIRDEAIDAVRDRWLAIRAAARTLSRGLRRRLAAHASGKRLLTAVMGFRALLDEALLSLCLVFAIAAVVAPIMVLAGLKFGFIEFVRSRYIQDSAYRLITPRDSQSRSASFFTRLREREDVVFVQPTVTLSNTSVQAEGRGQKSVAFDLVPTSAGDPLILENGGVVPAAGEVTLTALGAESLDVKAGGEVKLVINRFLAGRRDQQSVPLRVRSVLHVAADPEKRAYLGLDLVQDIENFRAGIPVTRRNWMGVTRPPEQAFDLAFVLVETPLEDFEIHSMQIKYTFAESSLIRPQDFAKATGLTPDDAVQIVLFANRGRPVRAQQLREMANQLGDRKFRILPAVNDLQVMPGASSQYVRVRTVDPTQFTISSLVQGDVASWTPWRTNASYIQVDRILVPKNLAARYPPGTRLKLKVRPGSLEDATQSLEVAVAVDGIVDYDAILMHAGLAGMLLQARAVPLQYDAALGALLPADVGLRGFRAYAKTIDDVPTIARALQSEGVEVRTEADSIERLQRLDAALTRITIIVAIVALLGGSAVLIASFYAAVERKKGDLSLLRLLGFSRGNIFSLPILQSAMLAVVGYLLALFLFLAFAELINAQYASDLTVAGSICHLEMQHFLLFAVASLAIASLSSLLAARRTLQIEPAEALRQE